jgi:hypothetical protein
MGSAIPVNDRDSGYAMAGDYTAMTARRMLRERERGLSEERTEMLARISDLEFAMAELSQTVEILRAIVVQRNPGGARD